MLDERPCEKELKCSTMVVETVVGLLMVVPLMSIMKEWASDLVIFSTLFHTIPREVKDEIVDRVAP